jgi:transcriptional regulator with XRE-family HTH domain
MGDYAKALGSKLRAIRQQQGLSLHGVEQKSGGRWKAVVVGSYERGDRAVTVQKLAELADFYGVPVAELLPEGRIPSGSEPATKIVINLERLQQLPADKVGPLARYAAAIQSQRGDYNGKVLSIRAEDLRSLAIIYDKTPGELTDQLIDWGVLPPEARPIGCRTPHGASHAPCGCQSAAGTATGCVDVTVAVRDRRHATTAMATPIAASTAPTAGGAA